MSTLTVFRLPDVGEGLTEAEVVEWHVKVGDRVQVNEVLVDIETAKSIVELPSPVAGVIETCHVVAGAVVPVGAPLVSIRADNAARVEEPNAPSPTSAEPEEQPLVLVGTGPTAAGARRRRLRPRDERRQSAPAAVRGVVRSDGMASIRLRTTPLVRTVAHELGVDISSLTTISGRITRADVERAALDPRSAGAPLAAETRSAIRGVRKATAAAMTASAFTAPHVTEWLLVDVTATMDLVARLKADRRWEGVRVSPLLLVAKAFLMAIKQHPEINAHWDDAAQEIVVHHDVNLGIAAATPRGLLVPNIKAANELDLRGLATSRDELVQTARAGRTAPEDMSRGTITITNIGALGVDAGTPILNPGEAAILAFGAVRELPWVVDGEIVVRKVTQLAMSFDHRLVDGELGSNVLTAVGRLLQDPALAMIHA